MSDIEESLKRITSHNGVMGVAVLDDAGKLARCAARRPLAACGARASCWIEPRARAGRCPAPVSAPPTPQPSARSGWSFVWVCGVRCAVCGVRCAVCGVRCAVCGVRCAVCGGVRAVGCGCCVWGVGFGVWCVGCARIWSNGLGFRVQGSGPRGGESALGACRRWSGSRVCVSSVALFKAAASAFRV
jgi:hypothetical protein